jgi:hypothetical protein
MPVAFRDRRFLPQIVCPCGAEDLVAALDGVVQHAAAVLAQTIGDPRRRDAVGVHRHLIEGDGVVLLRQVFADRHHAGAVAEQPAIGAMAFGAPQAGEGVPAAGSRREGD